MAMRVLFCLIVVFSALLSGSARAQDRQEERPAEAPSARALFAEGMAALDAGDAALAETHFRASLDLDARASTALNLALVLQERGALSEAITLYDRLLGGTYGQAPLSDDEIRTFRTRAEEDQAVLAIGTRGTEALEVTIDGEVKGALRPGAELAVRVDPGAHVVSGSNGDMSTEEQRVDVVRRERRRIELSLPEIAPLEIAAADETGDPLLVTTDEPRADEGGSSSALPFILVGLGAAAIIAAVIITAVVVSSSGTADHYRSGPFPNVSALMTP
jgi:hypothetical protein